MLRRLMLAAVLAAALVVPDTATFARPGGGGHGGGGRGGGGHSFNARSFSGTRSFSSNRLASRSVTRSVRSRSFASSGNRHGNGHHFSHRRHFYNGIWWNYGVGSCWTYDPYWGEYYWICD